MRRFFFPSHLQNRAFVNYFVTKNGFPSLFKPFSSESKHTPVSIDTSGMSLLDFLKRVNQRILLTDFSKFGSVLHATEDQDHGKLTIKDIEYKFADTLDPLFDLNEVFALLEKLGPFKVAFCDCTLPLLEQLKKYNYLVSSPLRAREASIIGFIKWSPVAILTDLAIYLFQPTVNSAPSHNNASLKFLLEDFKSNLIFNNPLTEDGFRSITAYQSRIIDILLHKLIGSFEKISKLTPWTLYQNIYALKLQLSVRAHRSLSKALYDQNHEYCLIHFNEYKDIILSDLNASSIILLALVKANKLGTLEEVCERLVKSYGESPIFYSSLVCAFLKAGQYQYAYEILSQYQGTLREQQIEPICYSLSVLRIASIGNKRSFLKEIPISQLELFLNYFIDIETGAPKELGSSFPFLLAILYRTSAEKARAPLSWLKNLPSEAKNSVVYFQAILSLPLVFYSLLEKDNNRSQFFQLLFNTFPEAELETVELRSHFVDQIKRPGNKILFHFLKAAIRYYAADLESNSSIINCIYFSTLICYFQGDHETIVNILQYLLNNPHITNNAPIPNKYDFNLNDEHQMRPATHFDNPSIVSLFHLHSFLSNVLLQACLKRLEFNLFAQAVVAFKSTRIGFSIHNLVLYKVLEGIGINTDSSRTNYGIISNSTTLYELATAISPETFTSPKSSGKCLFEVLQRDLNIKTAFHLRELFGLGSTQIPAVLNEFQTEMALISLKLELPEELKGCPSYSILLERIKIHPPPLRFLIYLRK